MQVRIMSMDLKSLQSVRAFVAEFQAAKLPPLKALVCNAGLKEIRVSVTPDGYEVPPATPHTASRFGFPSEHICCMSWNPGTRTCVVFC
jgi:NAD(P)-dependent dehydrogenase (short-subunit alcohol dehydrogenase family)